MPTPRRSVMKTLAVPAIMHPAQFEIQITLTMGRLC
jgi:hypothetical protein